MRTIRDMSELRRVLAGERAAGRSIGFVPTMGALHEGHISLLRAAREQNDFVVLSIFVNPLQFGPAEDLASYPRSEAEDLAAADAAGVDVAFLPAVEQMYPPGRATAVSVSGVSDPLEGAARPGHFDGVATVVAKLFNLVQPQRAYFGQKDAQQVAVIKAMCRDLSFPVDVVVCPTVRESDGLAMSSRNAYLGDAERAVAAAVWQALQAGRDVVAEGGSWEVAEKTMEDHIGRTPEVELEYARAVEPVSFRSPSATGPILLVIAARLGRARLIDNLVVER